MGFADVVSCLNTSGYFLQVDNERDEYFLFDGKTINISMCNATIGSNTPDSPPTLQYHLSFCGSSLCLQNVIIGKDVKFGLSATNIDIDNVLVKGELFAKGKVKLKNPQQHESGAIVLKGDITIECDEDKNLHLMTVRRPDSFNIVGHLTINKFYFEGCEEQSQETKMLNVALANGDQIIPLENCRLVTGSLEHCAPFRFEQADKVKVNMEPIAGQNPTSNLFLGMSDDELINIKALLMNTKTEGEPGGMPEEVKNSLMQMLETAESLRQSDA